ncbi:MAG: hypothetical protein IJG63_02000, partial [Oscillospiraceae bacterium]|nr:hypothetical protein [Oscillospiraceae bacterium]
MKAIMMAGGKGTRLRPISCDEPKPMTEFFDRPIMEYMISYLRGHGVEGIRATLCYLPEVIMDRFGDGGSLGVSLSYMVEDSPLGTAGSVKACSDFPGNEDFLVISGDCLCDFDLKGAIAFHREKKADATIVLTRCDEPLEYGLVSTDGEGRILGFTEKPDWGSVVTDLVNTGIYILSPEVLEFIPGNRNFDFGKDLFPLLLREKRKLYACRAEGRWYDIGNPQAYMACCRDVLDGVFSLPIPPSRLADRIFASRPIPQGVKLREPVYIGENVSLEAGCTIGPYAIIGEGSAVAKGAKVEHSAVCGAEIGENCRIAGAVICRGCVLGPGTAVRDGAVLGSGVRTGADCVVERDVRVWPGKTLEDDTRLDHDFFGSAGRADIAFVGSGQLYGDFNRDICCDTCLRIGAATARFERVAVAWAGGPAAGCAALALEAGICSGGAEAVETDADFASAHSHAAANLGIPLSVFIRQEDASLQLGFFGPGGLPLDKQIEREIKNGMSEAPESKKAGELIRISGVTEAYVSAASSGAECGGLKLSVSGKGAVNRALRRALSLAGCDVRSDALPSFRAENEGFALYAVDECGRELGPEELLAMVVTVELSSGAKDIYVPYSAPSVLDSIAEARDAVIHRVEGGKSADGPFAAGLALRDACFAAVRLVRAMSEHSCSLADIFDRVPRFAISESRVDVSNTGRARVMGELSSGYRSASLR